MKIKPRVCILRSDGTNCDQELFYAFERAGGIPEYVHVNELRNKDRTLSEFQIVALPGGFSYGDDIASGKVLAIELMSKLQDDLLRFIEKNGYLLGVCNGFQTLIRTGLLPFTTLGKMQATLTHNDSGHFECRWVQMKAVQSQASYFDDMNFPMHVAVNHGEGKFFAEQRVLDRVEKEKLVVFRYVDHAGTPTAEYPLNPNGALNAIAGITNSTGRILGLMPHPEKFVDITQYPNWRRENIEKPHGLLFYERIVDFVKKS
jgi:phosphoribosylformylglycinamidine synthase subunit PurQ / glutaminase